MLFDIWTKIPVTAKNSEYLNLTESAIYPGINVSPIWTEKLDKKLRHPDEFQEVLNKIYSELPNTDLAIGLTRDSVKTTPEAVENGVVFHIDGHSLNKTPTTKPWGYRAKQSAQYVPIASESVYALVLPLRMYARMMRLPLASLTYWAGNSYDFRLLLYYGCCPKVEYGYHSHEKMRDSLATFATHVNHMQTASLYNRLIEQPRIKQVSLIYKGQKLEATNYCTKCPRRVQWATGLCAFGEYNCVLSTDHHPDMLDSPAPNFTKFYGDGYKPKKECIPRSEFKSYFAFELPLTLSDDAKSTLVHRTEISRYAGLKRRYKNAICANCCLSSADCKHTIKYVTNCYGPVSELDLAANAIIVPWQAHMWLLSGAVVPNKELAKHFTGGYMRFKLHNTQISFNIVGPIQRKSKYHNVFMSIEANKRSAASQLLDQHVLVSRGKYPYYRLILLYEEVCDLIGVKPVYSLEALYELYPAVRKIPDRIKLGMFYEYILSYSVENVSRYKLNQYEFNRYTGNSLSPESKKYDLTGGTIPCAVISTNSWFETSKYGARRRLANEMLRIEIKNATKTFTPEHAAKFLAEQDAAWGHLE